MNHPTAGIVRVPGMAVKYSATADSGHRSPNTVAPSAPPRLGEHTLEVLSELGMSESEVRSLADRGVVGILHDK